MSMIPAKCTQCGANINVDDTKEAGICESCGTAFITEKAINNYEVTNNINVSNATININGADIENLLIRAEQYESRGDFDSAREYYNRILDIDANHEIAKSKFFDLGNLYIGSVKVTKEQLSQIENLLNKGEKITAIKLARDFSGLGLAEAKAFIDNYSTIDKSKPQDYANQLGSNTVNSKSSSGGCYVATCVYGSYDCPQVWTLRRFRDNTLSKTLFGRAFIHTYYAISPTIVKWFGNMNWFKKMWQGQLDRIVKNLNENGVDNTPYQDKNW